jgi:multiple sugar transport system permease protein
MARPLVATKPPRSSTVDAAVEASRRRRRPGRRRALVGWLYVTPTAVVRPGLITVALFAFLVSWNEFFAPLILLNSTDRFTMTLAVVNMRTTTHGSIDYAALEAGVVVMAVPCLLLFLFMRRGYVRGFMSGALKG